MNNTKHEKAINKAHELIKLEAWEDAKNHLQKSCKKFSKNFSLWHLYGAVCGQCNDIENALLACKKAIKLKPRDASSLYNLGMALNRAGLLDESINAYLKALKFDPDNAATHSNIGTVYKDRQQYDNAILHLTKTIELDPRKANAHFTLGTIYVELGQRDAALMHFEKCLSIDASQQSKIDYFKRFIEGKDINYQDHVAQLHDNHADTFDNHLTKGLDYNIPLILYEQYSTFYRTDDSDKIDLLDLGCGTGLCGREFQSLSQSMTGVDLSPKMLDIAKQTGLYDELLEDDIQHYIDNSTKTFDLILAADVFIYIGKIDAIIKRCAALLKPDGVIGFSVESIEDAPYKLRTSGRYAHSLEYIESLAQQCGLIIDKHEAVEIRKEHGIGLKGQTVYLKSKS